MGPCRVFRYAARVPHPPERAVKSVKEPGATPHPVLYFSFFGMVMLPHIARHGTFVQPIRLMNMSERATTKLIGLSLSGLFLVMLMLNAISS